MGKRNNDDRIGAINKNTFGSIMRVIEYNSYADIVVEFDQGKPIKTAWNAFSRGEVSNPYDKASCGGGILGRRRV